MTLRFLASLALAGLPGLALAGGLGAPPAPPLPAPSAPSAPPAAPADWSGPYVGAQLGFGALSAEGGAEGAVDGDRLAAFEGSGALAGVHAGYLLDLGRLVAGAELDWDASSLDLESAGPLAEEGLVVGSLDSVARLKARLGVDAGRLLPYVSAGMARGALSYDDPVAEEGLEDSASGRFVGLGADYQLSDRFTLGLEALRHDLDGPALRVPGDRDHDTQVDTVTLRGSFSF